MSFGTVFKPFRSDAPPRDRFLTCGACALFGILAARTEPYGSHATLVFVVLSFMFGGLRTLIEAMRGVVALRLDINFLMILAALASAALGHWDEGAILLFLFSLSDALERYAFERTRRGIRSVMALRPSIASLLRDGQEQPCRVEELEIGDQVRVRPGERFPVDGIILDGCGAVEEAVVTGESMPIDKGPEDTVLAGTINLDGSLLVRVSQPATHSTIERIVKLVDEAQQDRVAVQRWIDTWQPWYVYGVLCASAVTILGGILMVGDVSASVTRGMILLVAASPCAVVLASPVAVLATVASGTRRGILFKGGSAIERLAMADTLAFDKTGTVTQGRPRLMSVEPSDGHDAEALLATAAALERHSEHPLAAAVVEAALQRGVPLLEAEQFKNVTGIGIFGRVLGHWAGAGRQALFQEHGIDVSQALAARMNRPGGESAILVMRGDGLSGVLSFRDELRPEAVQAFAGLRRLGIKRFVMLTGDLVEPAARVAQQLGVSEFKAELRPEEKLHEIRKLTGSGLHVAMIGDGVNDAPALAAATVGVAMGAAGTDVAMEIADLALMRDHLGTFVDAVALSRRCQRVIRQSLMFAFLAMAGLVVLTFLGRLTLPWAVLCHEGSTVLVILNGLRLAGRANR